MLFLRNGRADWHGTKGMCVDRMLDHIVTLNCDLTHDLDPWFSRSNFENAITQEWDARLTWNERDVSRLNVGPMLWLSTLTAPWPLPWIFNVKFWNCCIPGMGVSFDMKQKRYESVGCYTYFVILNWPWPWIFKVKFKNAASQEWEGRLTWNQRDVSRQDVRLTLWLWTLTSPMTLTVDFLCHFFK